MLPKRKYKPDIKLEVIVRNRLKKQNSDEHENKQETIEYTSNPHFIVYIGKGSSWFYNECHFYDEIN